MANINVTRNLMALSIKLPDRLARPPLIPLPSPSVKEPHMLASALAYPRPTRFTVVNSGSPLFWGNPGGPMDGGNPAPKRRRKVTGHADGEAMRARILDAIRMAERPFNNWQELADVVGLAHFTVRYHLRRLRSAGKISFEDRRPWTVRIIGD